MLYERAGRGKVCHSKDSLTLLSCSDTVQQRKRKCRGTQKWGKGRWRDGLQSFTVTLYFCQTASCKYGLWWWYCLEVMVCSMVPKTYCYQHICCPIRAIRKMCFLFKNMLQKIHITFNGYINTHIFFKQYYVEIGLLLRANNAAKRRTGVKDTLLYIRSDTWRHFRGV